MTPTLEKVAKAIITAGGWDMRQWTIWRHEARAALEAISEPTPSMKRAVEDLRTRWPDADFAEMWEAAMRAALGEEQAP